MSYRNCGFLPKIDFKYFTLEDMEEYLQVEYGENIEEYYQLHYEFEQLLFVSGIQPLSKIPYEVK